MVCLSSNAQYLGLFYTFCIGVPASCLSRLSGPCPEKCWRPRLRFWLTNIYTLLQEVLLFAQAVFPPRARNKCNQMLKFQSLIHSWNYHLHHRRPGGTDREELCPDRKKKDWGNTMVSACLAIWLSRIKWVKPNPSHHLFLSKLVLSKTFRKLSSSEKPTLVYNRFFV